MDRGETLRPGVATGWLTRFLLIAASEGGQSKTLG
jgi:hypothetical protein